MDKKDLIARITFNPNTYGGKPLIRGHRLAVEHVLGKLAAGITTEELLRDYDWLEPEDIQACLLYAYRVMMHKEAWMLGLEDLDEEAEGYEVSIGQLHLVSSSDQA